MYIIPKVAPKTICKPTAKSTAKLSKSSKSRVDVQKRQIVNQKERERTSAMNQAFKNLKTLLNSGEDVSKMKTLEITNHYINFLYNVSSVFL